MTTLHRANVAIVCLLTATLAGCSCGGSGNDIDAGMTGPDADTSDAGPTADGGPPDGAAAVMSISAIIPEAASRRVDTELTVLGFNIVDGASLVLDNCDTSTSYDLSSTVAVASDGRSLTATLAADPTREQGLYTVVVTNPDSQTDSLECAFRILDADPPTIIDIEPASAYRGVAADGINSDQTVAVTGTGFQSTPNLRFVKTDNSRTYDALFVGFNSSTSLTAVVPSETLGMEVGDYYVYAINPDLLTGQWMVDATTPGIFRVTDVPPPIITDVTPQRITAANCDTTTITITGSGFATGAQVYWVQPAGTVCSGGIVAPTGEEWCPLATTVVDGGTITALSNLGYCPPLGAWPIIVVNPDLQSDIFRNIEIRNSNSGHLEATAFETVSATLKTARFAHGAEYGFDAFGNAYAYVVGGQDAAGSVLSDTEVSQFDIFGRPGAFSVAQQYLDPDSPRVANTLTAPRRGLSVVRVGRTLFALGGTATASDVAGTVAATATGERARILSYDEMPAIKLPVEQAGGTLPVGSWYYQVSAVGGWGEGLATREVVALQKGGTIEICWEPPAADDPASPASYNVYRSLASDGRAGTAAVIAYEVVDSDTSDSTICITDDGAGALTPAPGRLRGVLAAPSAGGLAVGDHLYRVSATIDLSGSPWQTYAGYSIDVAVTQTDVDNGQNAVVLNWDALPDTSATYNVYKWNAADQAYELLDGASGLTAATFADEGVGFADPVQNPPTEVRSLPPGSLSRWTDDVPDMLSPREGAEAVAVLLDPMATNTMGLVARIIVAGGRTSNQALAANPQANYLATAESLGIHDDGTLDVAWADENTVFGTPRVFYSLNTTQNRNVTDFPPPPEEPPCGDLDNDGYIDCDCAPPDTPIDQLDCNDGDPNIHPGATEICGDGIDQDCDMGCSGVDLPCACTTDADGDTHISEDLCGGDDCCDSGSESSLGCDATTAPGIHPGAIDICGNGIDEDCDGVDPPCLCSDDLDGDGHVSIACGGDDCCDTGTDTSLGCNDTTDSTIHPGAIDICGNGVDEDCDGGDLVCYQIQAPSQSAPTQAALPGRSKPRASAWVTKAAGSGSRGGALYDLLGGEAVYLIASMGDDDLPAAGGGGTVNNNVALNSFEVCGVDDTGHLDCAGQWVNQDPIFDNKDSFAMDAFLYFDYLYPVYGLSGESITSTGAVSRSLTTGAFSRYQIFDPDVVTLDALLSNKQSANLQPATLRSYYKGLRLLSYIYLVGGWTSSGPTATIERHAQ